MFILPAQLVASQPGYNGYYPVPGSYPPAAQLPSQQPRRTHPNQTGFYRPPPWQTRYATQPNPLAQRSPSRSSLTNRLKQPKAGVRPVPHSQQWAQVANPAFRNSAVFVDKSNPEITLETVLGDHLLYTQQGTVLTLRIISPVNLRTAAPHLPKMPNVLLKKLDGPVATLRDQKIVNVYHYALTPLLAGTFILPPIQVSGETVKGQKFNISSNDPLDLTILSIESASTPWFPLQDFAIKASLKNERSAQAGEPLILTIRMSAIGATGLQLPSLLSQLNKTRDFKVYRDTLETTGGVTADGRFLIGTRTETYTLIPLHGGRSRIPALTINWWNVINGSAETAIVPIRQFIVGGELGDFDPSATEKFTGNDSLLLWIPIISLWTITFGTWFFIWLRKQPFSRLVGAEFSIGMHLVLGFLKKLASWVSPIRRLQQMRLILVNNMPMSWRLWFCIGTIKHENDVEHWAYMVKFLTGKHYGIQHQRSMSSLGRQIAGIHPDATPGILCALMAQLDKQLYGKQTDFDFKKWKDDFRYQLRPRWVRKFSKKTEPEIPLKGLPKLNPQKV